MLSVGLIILILQVNARDATTWVNNVSHLVLSPIEFVEYLTMTASHFD